MGHDQLVSKVSAQWQEAEEILKSGGNKYESFDELKRIPFYNWLFQVLEIGIESLVVDIKDFNVLYRAVNEQDCNYGRFIPKWKFAGNNRMNGKDKLYYYFGTNYNNCVASAKETCAKEIRAKNDHYISFCRFEIVDNYKSGKLINLRKNYKIPRNEKETNTYLKDHYKKYGKKGIEIATARLLVNFFAESTAFEPVDNGKDHDHKYVPFWSITDYIESRGYLGVIYDSTVSIGISMALFDVKYAEPILGSIETIRYTD